MTRAAGNTGRAAGQQLEKMKAELQDRFPTEATKAVGTHFTARHEGDLRRPAKARGHQVRDALLGEKGHSHSTWEVQATCLTGVHRTSECPASVTVGKAALRMG